MTPVAIIGLACLFPEARSVREYWDNVVAKRDCIVDVPVSRWKIDDYYDPDPAAPDKTYSKRGGFIPDVEFDPMEFGLPPNTLEVTDNSQLLALLVAKQAIEDAGYGAGSGRILNRERTGCILGVGGGLKLITPLTSRLQYPVWETALRSSGISERETKEIVEKIKLAYIPWEENSFPGMLGNVIAGRIANRLDLGGMNCVVDAACASSLAGLRLALAELESGQCDTMLAGGVDADNSPFMYMCFSKTPAFTRGDRIRPFDADSDGMLIGEGIGMFVLRRLADAERDGDRIYAVIRGMGTSSDGRHKSIYAPRSEGQARALARAYDNADVPLASVGLIEAHGTGTVAGDLVEVGTLRQVFETGGARCESVAVGSVKSQIGHTKAAAGAAGLIKAALALHHKVLPPTINVDTPHPAGDFGQSALYVNTETRPWARQDDATPRRAGVSSFGFGGTNYHVVLEEYEREQTGTYRLNSVPRPILISAPTPEALAARCRQLARDLADSTRADAFAAMVASSANGAIPIEHARFGFVATHSAEALGLLQLGVDTMEKRAGVDHWEHPKRMFYRRQAYPLDCAICALFPGQGSQYVDMGRELAVNHPEYRETFAQYDAALRADGREPLSAVVYPPPGFGAAAKAEQESALRRTDLAQPAIGALSASMYRALLKIGLTVDFVAGHSFGELTALWAGGALDDADLVRLSIARGAAMAAPNEPGFDAGAMLAVAADEMSALAAIGSIEGVVVANANGPRQTVLAGPTLAIEQAAKALAATGLSTTRLPVAAAFHTPLVRHASEPFGSAVASTPLRVPRVPVYANATAEPYPVDLDAIRDQLVGQMLQPVRFHQQIENLYAAGARLFIEVGPRGVLGRLVSDILGERDHVVVVLNPNRTRDADQQMCEAQVELAVLGLDLDRRDLHARTPDPEKSPTGAATVLLNGSNYVSDKTRRAYADALAVEPPSAPQPDPHSEAPSSAVPHGSNGYAPESRFNGHAEIDPQTNGHSDAWPLAQLSRAHEVIERGLVEFARLQSETLHVHSQYLSGQAETTREFIRFMTQQQDLLLRAGAAELTSPIQQALGRGMDMFQDLQRDTLRVHELYLTRQTEQSQAYFAALGQSTGLTLGDREHANHRPALANGDVANLPKRPETVAPRPVVYAPPPSVVPSRSYPEVLPRSAQAATATVAPLTPPVSVPVAPAGPIERPQPHVPPADEERGRSTSPSAAPPPSVVRPGREELTTTLLAVVADKTGYPVDALEASMDLEADLGIDSIKRVEILGAMRDRFPSAPQLRPDELAELRTLEQIVAFLGGDEPAVVPSQIALTADVVAAAITDERTVVAASRTAAAHSMAPSSGVPWAEVRLQVLHPPDRLEVSPPAANCIVVVGDRSQLTDAVANEMTRLGWRVARIVPPNETSSPITAPSGVIQLSNLEEATLGRTIEHVVRDIGPVGGFVYVHPVLQDAALIDEAESTLVKAVFLLARNLAGALLGASAGGGRPIFAVVTRLDGECGLSGQRDNGAVAGGLFGLVKTLALEWPSVHCRAVDVAPEIEDDDALRLIMGELFDPNRLVVEVGHAPGRRTSPVALDGPPGARR